MPSVASRATSLANHYSKAPAQPGNVPFSPGMPTPLSPWLGRGAMMISSLPSPGTSYDSALRQFYGGRNLPARRVGK